MQTPAGKPGILAKPTLDTPYRVDFDWWSNKEELRMYLLSHLLPEQRDRLLQSAESKVVDFIDPETGEITRLDELQLAINQAAQDPNFITPHTSLVDGIFRCFLANGNQPLTPRDLEARIGRPAMTILKMLTAGRVYQGIRPYHG